MSFISILDPNTFLNINPKLLIIISRKMAASNLDGVINSTTSWRLAAGSLTHSISFESSFTTNQESDDEICSAADHVAKSPVLLFPPLPNVEPCEITITFAEEHEIRQVYIRSTARVYEVYYTKKRRHDKEYLCTVRCGIAMRGEEVLQIPLTVSTDFKNGVEPVKDSSERKVNNNGNGRTNEDDWVEVKAGDSLLNNENDLLSMPQLGKQELFEATAEIDDAEPCVSITLRLLSLQDKGCALVDEVYVFADPVDPSETEQEETRGMGNSSSSSLMAMFMPALMQLSRGKDVRKERDREVFEKSKSPNLGTLGNSNDSNKIVNEVQSETRLNKADHTGVSSPVLVDTLAKQISGSEITPSVSCNNVETILDQLVNKVSRIESILTRFEDQMLKPINSIDARLQIVEEKLEQLGKKSFKSELITETKLPKPDSLGSNTDKTPTTDELNGLSKITDDPQLASCTKVVAPESSSIITSEDCAVELPQKRLDNLTKLVELESENDLISGNETVSAEPESSNEEVSHSLGKESFEEKPKRSLSVNDALASALAGLLSSHTMTGRKCSQALIVTAPEFSSEDDIEIEEKPQIRPHLDKSQLAEEEFGKTYSTSEIPTSSHEESEITSCTETNSREPIYKVYEKLDDSFGGDNDAETVVSIGNNDLDEETVTSSIKEDCRDEPKSTDSLVHELDDSNATTGCGSSESKTAKEEHGMDNVLKDILGFEPTASVDFLAPVLDVKFNSEDKISDSECLFESLFTGESKRVVDCNNEAVDEYLVSVDYEEHGSPPTDTLSSLTMNHYDTNEMLVQLNAEISEASLI